MSLRPKRASDWEKQFHYDLRFAERMLLEKGQVAQMFMVHHHNRLDIFQCGWRSDMEKAETAEYLRLYCIANDADALCQMGEAWMLLADPKDPDALLDGPVPSESPKRIEVVQVILRYRDDADECHNLYSIRKIQRRANGKPSGLLPHRTRSDFKLAGDFGDRLLPDGRPSTREQEEARAALAAMMMTQVPVHTVH